MHPMLVEEVVKVCRQRSAEGDCPTVDAPSRETLEDCVIALADDRRQILVTLADAFMKFAPDLAHELRERWNVATGKELLALLQNQPST